MKIQLLSSTLFCALFGACSKQVAPPVTTSDKAIVSAAHVSGLNASYMDNLIRPQDNLYRYVNGKWLDTVEIPADKARYGVFHELDDHAESQLRDIVESLQKEGEALKEADAIKVRDIYASFMDEARLETLGLQPLQTELQAIDKLDSVTAVISYMGQMSQSGVDVPLVPHVHQDNRDSTRYAVDLSQSGLGLPDRDYYLKDGEGATYK